MSRSRQDETGTARSPGQGEPPFLLSRAGVALCAASLLAAVLMFRLFPWVDLGAAAFFYVGHGHFIGQGFWGERLRQLFSWLPFAILLACAVLYGLQRAGRNTFWSPGGRGLMFLVSSLALGPGLLVNVTLKDHWHRPRPAQIVDFGGTMAFRPFYRTDGACARNCSFVSGEGSSAFWSVAPALLAPAALQPWAVMAAVGFGLAASLLRMAFGGHFLSDNVFAALLTWLVVALAWRVVFRSRPRPFGTAVPPPGETGQAVSKS